jgi:hypothetical protein
LSILAPIPMVSFRNRNALRSTLLLAVCALSGELVTSSSAQAPPIQFSNITVAAGIKFAHFKGNNGISINREEFGPGVCVADF